LNELQDLEFRKIVVRGKFDHSKELYLTPRSLVPGSLPETSVGHSNKRKLPDKVQSGANVITAFKVDSDVHPK
jgi:hypothetical protein